jgi:hypothetical protein
MGASWVYLAKREKGFPAVDEVAGEKILDLTDGSRFTNIIIKRRKEEDMKILIGDFLLILKGAIPIILVLGGALAIYLGIEDIKTTSASPPPEEKPAEKKE